MQRTLQHTNRRTPVRRSRTHLLDIGPTTDTRLSGRCTRACTDLYVDSQCAGVCSSHVGLDWIELNMVLLIGDLKMRKLSGVVTQHNVVVCLVGTSVEGVMCMYWKSEVASLVPGKFPLWGGSRGPRCQAAGTPGCRTYRKESKDVPLLSFLHVCIARDLSRQSRVFKIKLRRQI
jgi:hypothetical protein